MPIQEPEAEVGASLPPCVATALDAADNLYKAILGLPFPNLDDAVDSIEAAAAIIYQAVIWSHQVERQHRAVMKLFPPRDLGVEVMPNPVRAAPMMQRDSTGRPVMFMHQEDPEPAVGKIVRRMSRMDVASDVIELVPPRFADSLAAAFPFRRLDGLEPVPQTMPSWIAHEWTTMGWPTIRVRLSQARIVVRAKCLGLVGWIRERVTEMKAATHPSIKWKARSKNKGQIVEVSMAGAKRETILSNGEHALLARLARGDASATRTLKAALMSKLPELSPYIQSLGAAGRETRYAVPAEIRDLIRVNPPR